MNKNFDVFPTVAELQAEFDRTRGFANLPFRHAEILPETYSTLVSKLEFAALGLGGEVGEIQNIVKKARRRFALGHEGEINDRAITDEIADVYSYLMKLSNILKIDLDQAYLEKRCINALRFPPVEVGEHTVVTIVGPPGSGKTTGAKFLSQKLGKDASVYTEDYEKNPYFQANGSADFDILKSQSWFINEYNNFIKSQTLNDIIVLDQEPAAVPLVYGKSFLDRDAMTVLDYKLHLHDTTRLQCTLDKIVKKRVIIYIKCDTASLLQRCADKPYATLEWLEEISTRFESMFEDVPTVTIENWNKTESEFCEELLSLVMSQTSSESDAADVR